MSRVLLVHHEPVSRLFLASYLEHEGFDVIQSSKTEDALRLLQEQDSIDVLLIDLHLPGVSGWDCCRLLRHAYHGRFARIPFVCLSSRVSQAEGDRMASRLGGQAFLSLPVEPGTLRQSLDDVLAGKRLVPSPRLLLVGDAAERWIEHIRSFQQQGWVVQECRRVDDVQSKVVDYPPDLIIIHHSVSDIPSLDWVTQLKDHSPLARIMLVTDDQDPDLGVEALRCGVHEFIRGPIAPGYLDLLLAKTERARLEDVFDLEDQSPVPASNQDHGELKRFLHIFDQIVILVDGDGVIVEMNAHGKKVLEWTPQEICGQNMKFLDPSGTLERLTAGQKNFHTQETRFRTRDGQTLDVLVSGYAVTWPEGVRCILVANHHQELASLRAEVRRLQDQVRELQDLESIEQVAGGIAHDVNNILMAIQGHASLLTYKGLTNPSTQRPAEVIRQAAHRGQELTAQLLGKARRGTERRSSVNVHDTIDEVLALLSDTRLVGIDVTRDFQAQDAWIRVNSRQLHQVVLNLIVNACDAMPKGGSMKISTISHQAGDSFVHQGPPFPHECFLELVVADTGCGIPKDLQHAVFEPFFSTKPAKQGSGMGLAIVKGIVEAQGGHIAIVSEVNHGTAFHLCFPQSQQGPSGLIHLPTVLGATHPKILVVDDEPLVVETTMEMLRVLGCEPLLAQSGEEAIELYRKQSGEISVILLDLSMPSMNGEDCFQALRAINPSVKVVFASGLDGTDSVQRYVDEGLAGFVQKPFDVDDLSLAFMHVFSETRQNKGYALSGVTAGTKEGL